MQSATHRRPPSISVLLVEEDGDSRRRIRRALEQAPVPPRRIREAACLAEARAVLESEEPWDCVLLDEILPDGTALELLRSAGSLPSVVVLSGQRDERLAARLLAEGAQDLLAKDDLDPLRLDRSLRNAIQRHRQLRARDRRLQRIAWRDPLTGLLNRRGLEAALANLGPGESTCGLLVDCDRFKAINEAFGHAAGDAVLEGIASRLHSLVRGADWLGRVGGDEFLIILRDGDHDRARAVAERVREAVAGSPLRAGGATVRATVSVGLSFLPPSVRELRDLLTATRAPLARAKAGGRDRVEAVDAPADESPERVAGGLRRGAGLSHVVQPVVAVPSGRTIGWEIFARGPRGWELPRQFLALASEVDALTEVDLRCLESGLALAEEHDLAEVHVNLAAETLLAVDEEALRARLRPWAGRLVIGLSAEARRLDLSRLAERRRVLREERVRLALDGIGSGRSNLDLVLQVEPDLLKTHPRLAAGLVGEEGPEAPGALRRLVRFAGALSTPVVLVGLEPEPARLWYAQDLGISFVQPGAARSPEALGEEPVPIAFPGPRRRRPGG